MPPAKRMKRECSSSSDDSQCSTNLLLTITKLKPDPLKLLDLPTEILQNVFKHLPFETISKNRLVSHRFNEIGSSMLNAEFQRIRLMMQQRFQHIKAQMPRRESARRKHPLARESDIVETLHMRLTLLQMTFGKHVERKHCCFFAGEILDEVYKILNYIKATANLSRVYKVTDELFDLSTMAMEYFKEHIEPTLPEITYFATDIFDYTPSFSSSSPKSQLYLMDDPATASTCLSPSLPSTSNAPVNVQPHNTNFAPPGVRKRLRKLTESVKKNNGQVLTLKRELKLAQRRVTNQQKQINQLKFRYDDYDKKYQSTSRKLNAVLQELSRCKTELQYWRSKSPAAHCTCGKITPVSELKDFHDHSMPPFVFNDFNNDLLMEPLNNDDDSDDFKPIMVEPESKSTINPVLVVPACHTTPAESKQTQSNGSPKKLETAIERKSVIEATFLGPNKPLTRACKRKLDMDGNQ